MMIMINEQFSSRETTQAVYYGDNILAKSMITNVYDVDFVFINVLKKLPKYCLFYLDVLLLDIHMHDHK